jgi:hypothetical protein
VVPFSDITSTPNFIKIYWSVQKLLGGTDRQTGDLIISLLSFMESKLNMTGKVYFDGVYIFQMCLCKIPLLYRLDVCLLQLRINFISSILCQTPVEEMSSTNVYVQKHTSRQLTRFLGYKMMFSNYRGYAHWMVGWLLRHELYRTVFLKTVVHSASPGGLRQSAGGFGRKRIAKIVSHT